MESVTLRRGWTESLRFITGVANHYLTPAQANAALGEPLPLR
jgi:hypothetical protein